jgi:hypothetical protein
LPVFLIGHLKGPSSHAMVHDVRSWYDTMVTAGYFYDTFAYEICFYGIYFYGIYIYGI